MANRSVSVQFRVVARWIGTRPLCQFLCALVLGLCWNASAATFTTFDVPNAVVAYPVSMNDAGMIAGIYADDSHVLKGFVRTRDGTVTIFAAPPGGSLTSALSISLFIMCSSWFRGWLGGRCCMGRSR